MSILGDILGLPFEIIEDVAGDIKDVLEEL